MEFVRPSPKDPAIEEYKSFLTARLKKELKRRKELGGGDGRDTGSESWEEVTTIFNARVRDSSGGVNIVELEPEKMDDDDPELKARAMAALEEMYEMDCRARKTRACKTIK